MGFRRERLVARAIDFRVSNPCFPAFSAVGCALVSHPSNRHTVLHFSISSFPSEPVSPHLRYQYRYFVPRRSSWNMKCRIPTSCLHGRIPTDPVSEPAKPEIMTPERDDDCRERTKKKTSRSPVLGCQHSSIMSSRCLFCLRQR